MSERTPTRIAIGGGFGGVRTIGRLASLGRRTGPFGGRADVTRRKETSMDTVVDSMLAIRRLVRAIADRLQWLPPTLARLTVGWIFFWSGWGKLHDLDHVIEFFGSLGIPHPELQAPFASATELVCGAAMLMGLFTRIASVPLVIVMLVAITTAQRENVSSLGDVFGLSEYLYVTLLVWLGVGGAGPLSLDRVLVRWAARRDEVRGAPAIAGLATTPR